MLAGSFREEIILLYKLLLTVQYVSIILMIYLCAYIIKRWSKPAHGWLFFYSIATAVNNAGYLALMHAQTESEALLIWQFIYICRAWIPFTLLGFVLILCAKKRHPIIMNVLAVFHALSYFMVLGMRFNHLYYSSYRFVENGIFPHFEHTNGIFHYVIDALCISYVFVVMRLLIKSIVEEKNLRKKRKFIITTVAILTVIIFYFCQLFHVIPGYDMNTLGFTCAAGIFYIAIFGFDILDTKNISEAVVVQETVPEPEQKQPKIEAFGNRDSRLQIPLSKILYFEADSEQVFAYTLEEIYNVKLRLYQVEEQARSAGIIRVSKSHLINVRKIESVRPALNSRMYVKMPNGEEVLVSRKYARSLKDAIG